TCACRTSDWLAYIPPESIAIITSTTDSSIRVKPFLCILKSCDEYKGTLVFKLCNIICGRCSSSARNACGIITALFPCQYIAIGRLAVIKLGVKSQSLLDFKYRRYR